MKFGVVLPTYPAGATVEGFTRVAQVAEELGFVSAWTTDHVILPEGQAGPYREIFEPLMATAYVAAHTHTIRLGISVIVVPQRQGIVLAKQLATLDHLTNGRLIVGVGAGWNEDEFRMLEREDIFHRRGAYLDETLRVWRHLWTNPGTPFSGQFYDLPEVAFGPAPVQPGGPPIWVGGASPAARRRAMQYGSVWHPVGMPITRIEEDAKLFEQLRAKLDSEPPKIAPRLPMYIGEAVPGQMTAGRHQVLTGSASEVVEGLRPYRDHGVTEIDCLFGSPDPDVVIEQMRIFSAEVRPALES